MSSLGRAIQLRLRGKTASGLLASFMWLGARYFVPLLTFPYLARVLGVEGFGLLAVGAAVVAYALVLTDWGFNISSMRDVAVSRDAPLRVQEIVWSTIGARMIIGTASAGIVVAGSMLFVTNPLLQLVLIVSTLNVAGSVLNVDWALRGLEEFSKFATASIIGRMSTVPLIYIFVREADDVALAALAQAAGTILAACLSLLMLIRLGAVGRPRFSLGATSARVIGSWQLFVSNAAVSLYTNSLQVVLGAISGVGQLGLFSGADKIRMPVQSLLSPISMVFYPRMAYLADADEAQASKRALQLFRIQGGIALLIAAGLFVTAPFLVVILLGDAFGASVPVLRILSVLVLLIGASNVLGLMILVPFGLKRQFTTCIVAGAAVGFGLVFPLSAEYGAIGTALAAVAAETVVTISMFIVVTRRFAWFRPFRVRNGA